MIPYNAQKPRDSEHGKIILLQSMQNQNSCVMDMTLNHPEQLLWVFNNKFLVHAMAPRRAPHS